MEIISHRGLWETETEKNTVTAFEKSFKNGYGTETDFRDYKGEVVISHDMASEESIKASVFFEIYNSFEQKNTLALNIKADGLQKPMLELLKRYEIKHYYAFDMSIPDTLGYLRKEIPFLSRQSEYEQVPNLYDSCVGIWLDCFEKIWYSEELIKNHLKNNKSVTFVSPELHKRNPEEFWNFLKFSGFSKLPNLILCTDLPQEAETFFN
jgi:hypothetical protein